MNTISVKEALLHALVWHEEYKRINHLSGDPFWVPIAYQALEAEADPENKRKVILDRITAPKI